MLKLSIPLLLICLVNIACANQMQPIKVKIESAEGGYQLLRNGKPYHIRGVGLGVDAPNTKALMAELKLRGGNSLRTWHVGDGSFLDDAHELGLTVSLCLDIKRERHGFDYGDPVAVQKQFEQVKRQVIKYRNHPALLTWVIGNELNHDYTDPRVYDAVNAISKMIHELDPNHPTTTTTAGINAELAGVINERAGDIDFISVQVYGGLFDLLPALETIDLKKPLMLTEWGTIGHWEVPTTEWHAPIELNSSEKATVYQRGIDEIFPQLDGVLIGNYAFLWGQKQERTPTWYGLFFEDYATEAVNNLERFWTGEVKTSLAPKVQDFTLDGRRAEDNIRLSAGKTYAVQAMVNGHGEDILSYRWVLLDESTATQSGGDAEEVPTEHLQFLDKPTSHQPVLTAPKAAGAYRLFMYAYDNGGSVAHANIPFFVQAGD